MQIYVAEGFRYDGPNVHRAVKVQRMNVLLVKCAVDSYTDSICILTVHQ
jgi:hypothetical protein